MARQTVMSRKKRGPPPTGKGAPIVVRMQPAQLAALDAWIGNQTEATSRPAAIRRLVEQALERVPRTGATPPAKAQKAMEIASQVIDKVADKSLPPEVQAHRKRALIRGPKEFRDLRDNQPKKKA